MTEVFIPSSSHLDQVTYDEAAKLLTIMFKDGRSYQYSGVPKETYLGLQHARSVGEFFYRNIKSRYVGAEV